MISTGEQPGKYKKHAMEVQLPGKITGIEKWFGCDEAFDRLYPATVQALSKRHWTPLQVAKEAAAFLATGEGVNILDVGSGAGKFCLAAAYYYPKPFYYGIEQRKNLVYNAETARQVLRLDNVSFIHGNFTQVDFRQYDHFYFYNSFYENITAVNRMDETIDYSVELYNYYNRYMFKQLEQTRPGTRLATFYSMEDEVPSGFHVVGSSPDHLLKCWIKV
jgi:SAM-dependent methyltransferase